MRIQWYGQSAFALTGDEASVFIDPFADMTPLAGTRYAVGVPGDLRTSQPHLLLVTHEHLDHNGVEAIERRANDPALDGRQARVADRRGRGRRVRARPGRGHRARAQHDLRVHARWGAGRSLRRLRSGRAARRAGCGDRRGRPGVRAGRRRRRPSDAAAGPGDRRPPAPALGRADALPHATGSGSSSPPTSSWTRSARFTAPTSLASRPPTCRRARSRSRSCLRIPDQRGRRERRGRGAAWR